MGSPDSPDPKRPSKISFTGGVGLEARMSQAEKSGKSKKLKTMNITTLSRNLAEKREERKLGEDRDWGRYLCLKVGETG